MHANPVPQTFSTDDFPREVRQQLWREKASQAFVELDVSFHGELECKGHLSKSRIGDWALTNIYSTESVVRRRSSALKHSDADCFLLSLQLKGESTIVQDQRKSTLAAGDIAIYDTTRPYDLILHSPNSQLVFEIPRDDCSRSIPNHRKWTACKLQSTDAKTTSYRQSLLSVLQASNVETTRPNDLVAALDLLANIYASKEYPGHSQRPITASLRLMSIKNHVLANISDPSLNQISVAEEFKISRRYLNRLFENHESSFASWLRQQRLKRCRTDLRDPAQRHLSVLDVACKWGFNDAAHFSRIFKKQYQVTPMECRHSAVID